MKKEDSLIIIDEHATTIGIEWAKKADYIDLIFAYNWSKDFTNLLFDDGVLPDAKAAASSLKTHGSNRAEKLYSYLTVYLEKYFKHGWNNYDADCFLTAWCNGVIYCYDEIRNRTL